MQVAALRCSGYKAGNLGRNGAHLNKERATGSSLDEATGPEVDLLHCVVVGKEAHHQIRIAPDAGYVGCRGGTGCDHGFRRRDLSAPYRHCEAFAEQATHEGRPHFPQSNHRDSHVGDPMFSARTMWGGEAVGSRFVGPQEATIKQVEIDFAFLTTSVAYLA